MNERIEIGLRRVPELEGRGPLPDSDPRLLAAIRSEIEAGGPMTFARFMEIALYDPEAGYYAGAGDDAQAGGDDDTAGSLDRGPGRAADFLTAPESHPIFGWALARRLVQLWGELGRPDRFVVREHGAGSGALAIGIIDGLRRADSPLLAAIRYQAIDISPPATAAFGAAVEAAGLGAWIEPGDDRSAQGAVIANELLDALPVHRVEGGPDGHLLERFVDLGPAGDAHHAGDANPAGPLTTVLGAPSTPALAARLEGEGIDLAPGQPAEVCLALDDWVRAAVEPLERGLLLVIDYGYPANELYDPARGSTLRAYHRHRVHADPLVAIGRQDLTAHVDLTAVERAAAVAGLHLVRRARQAEYLVGLGLGDLLVGLQSGPGATLESYLAARSAVVPMLDPRASGRFAVLELGR